MTDFLTKMDSNNKIEIPEEIIKPDKYNKYNIIK